MTRILFILAILILLVLVPLIFFGHQGVAQTLLKISFLFFALGTIFYFIESR